LPCHLQKAIYIAESRFSKPLYFGRPKDIRLSAYCGHPHCGPPLEVDGQFAEVSGDDLSRQFELLAKLLQLVKRPRRDVVAALPYLSLCRL